MEIFETRAQWAEEYENGWLKYFKETGETSFKPYPRPTNHNGIPGKGIDLSKSRLMLISSAGGYLKGVQDAFDAEHPVGDYTMRVFPAGTPFDAIDFAHTHYDHTFVNTDPQVLLPLRHLEQMVTDGKIGSLAPVVSFMGYQRDAREVVDGLIPQIIATAKEHHADAAFLVPS